MQQFRVIRRKSGVYYSVDRITRIQASLKTKDKEEALRLLSAKNEAAEQPALNRHIAKAYLAASDPKMVMRTWAEVLWRNYRLEERPHKRAVGACAGCPVTV